MDIPYYFFGSFYILIGVFFMLTGFKIIYPFKNNQEIRKRINDNLNMYRFGGIGLIIFGVLKILI